MVSLNGHRHWDYNAFRAVGYTESIHLLGNKSIFDLFFLVINRLGRDRACLVHFQISSVNKRQGSGLCQT